METILQVWSRSYSTTKIKAKKEQLKTEKKDFARFGKGEAGDNYLRSLEDHEPTNLLNPTYGG